MAKRVSLYGILVALAFIASYIELLIPFNFHVPGMKLGLANIVVLIALYTGGAGAGITVSVIRIILVGFTFGNPYSAIYGLSGGILSFVKKSKITISRLLDKLIGKNLIWRLKLL